MVTSTSIHLLSLGGTIAMGARGPEGILVSLDAAALCASVAGEFPDVQLMGRDVAAVDSSTLDLDDVLDLVAAIDEAVAAGAHAVVVTTGTDTLEEVAFALQRLVAPTRVGIVLTGAMRSPTVVSHDGPANLRAALAVAQRPDVADLGVVVVMNDDIHGADFVAKSHATSTASFTSYPGALGWVGDGHSVVLTVPAPARARLAGPVGRGPRRVPLVTSYLGDEALLVGVVRDASLDGLVVEAFGSGRVTPATADVLVELATRLPVVVASRTGSGLVERGTYAGQGSEARLWRHGVVSAGWLPGLKARALLELLVRSGASAESVRATFAEFSL
jgi:L-asparaginase